MISIKGLNKFFNKGKQNEIHVINDVTLDLPERGMCAIFGKSGCGKTTLLNVIGGLDGFSAGSLTIEGNNIAKKTDEIRNKYIGYIFQNYNLNKSESCYDNIADALRLCGMNDEEEIAKRVDAALKNVGMEKYAKRTPDTLSGGQQQRIAIARAIVKNPRIILADEPTGNLDEANTLMIMDLLSEIAKDHLVLLVTHEVNLVDAYCNKIIELSDGKVVDVREGSLDGSFSQRSKQDIYLGELDRREISSPDVSIEYYGEPSKDPIKIKIVNKDGHLYLQLGTERVQIIDGTGEVRLIDGKYEKKSPTEKHSHINMDALPEVSGNKFGSLFTFKSSVKSGYKANFVGAKKGKKALRRVLILFALVVVFVSTVFGRAIGDIINASDSYNHNIFYVYNKDSRTFDKLHAALSDPNSAVDEIRQTPYYPSGENNVSFFSASFETFKQPAYSSGNYVKAAILSTNLTEGKELLAGSLDLPSGEYVLISEVTANDIIEKSTVGFVDDYNDLIGMTSTLYNVNGKNLRVGGVVKTGERAVYLHEHTLASYTMGYYGGSIMKVGENFNIPVEDGKAVFVQAYSFRDDKAPYIGETIKISGKSVEVVDVIKRYNNYSEWLVGKKIIKQSKDTFFVSLLEQQNPNLEFGSAEFTDALREIENERYFEYEDYYYEELDRFIHEMLILIPDDFELWLYCEKGISEIKYIYCSKAYVYAQTFKEKNGRYPTLEESDAVFDADDYLVPNFGNIEINHPVDTVKYYDLYQEEFHSANRDKIYNDACLVSESDYIDISRRFGDTDKRLEAFGVSFLYTVVHSSDPEKTEAWLNEHLGDLTDDYYDVIITPDDTFNTIIEYSKEQTTGFIISIIVIIAIMSLCMFFIMRSSMLNRIKEVGIYRAIGVSKKNLIFRFAIESLVLTLLTVFVGYLMTSGFIWLCLGVSPLVESAFFYPLWYALIVLVVLFAISIISGILPLLSLLRKTPSEILAKYDI